MKLKLAMKNSILFVHKKCFDSFYYEPAGRIYRPRLIHIARRAARAFLTADIYTADYAQFIEYH